MAPSTSGFGARSEPMASTAITVLICRCGTSVLHLLCTRGEDVKLTPPNGGRRRELTCVSPAAEAAGRDLSSLFYFHDLASLVMTTLRAHAMRHLLLVTVRTLRSRMHFEMVVSTPRCRAPFGVSPF